ncbi:MAG: nucleoside triphosphate pyrophosphohydrolase family protein [bacterium]|nr:nucleoside triphosphate pyrophosphohydrolase family protein [bacterium]
MELNEYQKKALRTANYEEKYKIIYPVLGLGNEAGEVMGKVKKWLRGDDGVGVLSDERRQALKEEMGDVFWYLAVLARDLDLTLEEIADVNIKKLESRQARGTIKGDGDNR